jgi:1-acyl-sn-glycerol-3-phosphate acyltransferase
MRASPHGNAGRGHDRRYAMLRRACALLAVPYFRPVVEYGSPLPESGFIVACTHTTLLDWAAVAYAIPRPVRFLITREWYERPVVRRLCRWGGAIPVRSTGIEPSAFRLARAALGRGEVIGIFPEGAISRDGRPLAFQRGVARLAQLSGCPVVPMTIRGAFEAFPYHRRFPRPRRVVIATGPPLHPQGSAGRPPRLGDCAALVAELRARMRNLAAERLLASP